MRKVFLVLLCVLCLGAGRPRRVYRARVPERFDRVTVSVFEEDAFRLLVGSRPDYGRVVVEERKSEEERVVGVGDFDRRDMMKKLEEAESSLADLLGDERRFLSGASRVNSSADLMMMMGRVMFTNDPEHGDDDDFLKAAEELMEGAKGLKIFVKKGDYEGAGVSFARVRKSCDSCHEKFR